MHQSVHSPRTRRRVAKLKSVTFTGCWTCRSRKVKCDERQRDGCRVCESSRISCAGYGVNLSWVTGRKQDLQGLLRRRIKPDRPAAPAMSDHEIIKAISALDAISAPSDTVVMGPFAVFQAEHPSAVAERSAGRPSGPVCEEIQSSDLLSDQPGIGCEVDADPKPDYSEAADSTPDYLPDASEMQSPESSGEYDAPPTPSRFDSNKPSSHGSELSCSSKANVVPVSSPHLGLSMPLFRDRQTAMLMYHYVNHVAELLQPVLHPQNPWRTTYFPFALEGCPDLFLCQQVVTPSSHASTALFHGLLSAAAFHLRNTTGASTEFHQLGLRHRIMALRSLNGAVIHPNNPQFDVVYLTAMLSLVTIDTMTGEDSDYLIHLRACNHLRKGPSYFSRLGNSINPVNTICSFLTLLARTTSYEIEPRPWPADGAVLDLSHFRNDERSTEHMYGITPALGNLLHRTCQLAEYTAFYRELRKPVPAPLQEACLMLRDDISSWTIESGPFLLIQRQERSMFEIVQCQARAFHGAVVLFYLRTVQNTSGTDNVPAAGVEAMVQVIWQNLERAEDLKDAYMDGAKRTAPMSWPAFIGACEAKDRGPWVEWWARVQGYGIGNLARQWRVIQELWALMDADDSLADWRHALQRTHRQVLPI